MTSFGNIRCYLATIASKPCFALYVIHLVVRGLFSILLVLLYSAELPLVCYICNLCIFSSIFVKRTFNRFATIIFDVNDDAFDRYKKIRDPLFFPNCTLY